MIEEAVYLDKPSPHEDPKLGHEVLWRFQVQAAQLDQALLHANCTWVAELNFNDDDRDIHIK